MSAAGQPLLLFRGGHVIDPATGLDGPADVAVADGRVAAVGPNLPAHPAARVIDFAGNYVTPGLIDIHAHVFPGHRRSSLSLDPHLHTFSSAVTTVVDAGTTGWRDLECLS